MTRLLLHRWADVRLIEKILSRDYVGDGQIPYVVDHELAAIDERCFEKVVMDSRIYGKPCYLPSWTVVDNVVTLHER